MIYSISSISSRDITLLHIYRILRHQSQTLNEMYRYSTPDVRQIEKAVETEREGSTIFEYQIPIDVEKNKIPFLEFFCADEDNLKSIEDFTEVEVTSDSLIIRSTSNRLSGPLDVIIYQVYSLAQVEKILEEIAATIDDLDDRLDKLESTIGNIQIKGNWVLSLDGAVPNLVNIGEDNEGLIYNDSSYQLSGAVKEQQLINPSQETISYMLKVITGRLSVKVLDNLSRVFQGFSGGIIYLESSADTLVLKDCSAIIQIGKITARTLIIDNCPNVLFQPNSSDSLDSVVKVLEVRHSNVTLDKMCQFYQVMLSRNSVLMQSTGIVKTIYFLEAGSTYCLEEMNSKNKVESFNIKKAQGSFIYLGKDELPILDFETIAFRKGQVEDPLPVSKVHVNIHISGASSSGQQPTTYKIYTPYTSWYWSGDYRTVGLIDSAHIDGQGYSYSGIDMLERVKSDIIAASADHNLALWWGLMDLDPGYASIYKEIAQELGDDSTVFVCTVPRVLNTGGGTIGTEGWTGDTPLSEYNERIKEWNTNLKNSLNGETKIKILDVWQYVENLLKSNSESALAKGPGEGFYYSDATYKKIYDWCNSQITNSQSTLGDWANKPANGQVDIMLIYDALRNCGWSRNAAIGALGNMRHESNWITHMIGYNSRYFVSYSKRSREDLLTLMDSATSRIDLFNKIQATTTDGNLTGYGLTQFTSQDNIGALYDQHVASGLPYDTLGVQIPAFKQVLEQYNWFDTMNSKSTPGEAAYYLCIMYERPVDKYQQAAKRATEANNLANQYDFYY